MNYNESHIKKLLPNRPENSHKGTFGHVLNIAGSIYYQGAAFFSSISALKVGCGLVTLASVEPVLNSVSAIAPDIIYLPLEQTKEKTISEKAIKTIQKNIEKYDVISIGCGISKNKHTVNFFKKIFNSLGKSEKPTVIDADGLNILSVSDSKTIENMPKNLVLTPHPKELSRLLSVEIEEVLTEPKIWIKKCSEKYRCTTVLKLHKTLVADYNGNFYENNTGSSALSHGGSGDILCGMISGFLAQGVALFDASCLAVYLHGLTAEIASRELTEYSTINSKLIDFIPQAIKSIL